MKTNRIRRGILWYTAWLVLIPLGAWSLCASHPLSILLIGPIVVLAIYLCFDFHKCAQCGKKVGRITAKITNCPFCGHELWSPAENGGNRIAQQPDTVQPATRPVVEPEGGDKPQSEEEGRSR